MRYRAACLAGGVAIAALGACAANAAVLITVDKSAQEMTVEVDGATRWQWKVSTGRTGHDTPNGTFRALSMDADHYSKQYDDAPMPHSIFFTNAGHAIHGSFVVRRLGAPASHGCVRVEPANATRLFALIAQQGMRNTTIVITGNAANAIARARTPAPAAAPAPAAQPSHPTATSTAADAAKTQAAPLTLAPPPAAQRTYRQAFVAQNAEPPVPPPSYPPFPRPWSVSSDLR
jgi:L,D-transpeptidase catalytic domain